MKIIEQKDRNLFRVVVIVLLCANIGLSIMLLSDKKITGDAPLSGTRNVQSEDRTTMVNTYVASIKTESDAENDKHTGQLDTLAIQEIVEKIIEEAIKKRMGTNLESEDLFFLGGMSAHVIN